MLHSANAGVAGPGLVTLANVFNTATLMPEVRTVKSNVESAYSHQSPVRKALSGLRRMLAYKAPAEVAGMGLMNSVIRTATIGTARS